MTIYSKSIPKTSVGTGVCLHHTYTESNFDTTAVSWAGAKGLMQLMPATARAMGVPPGKEQNPEESVKAAIKYITATDRSFSMIPDKQERLNFILASYKPVWDIYMTQWH